jgi:molybdenum cofactor cytidylyltransferase
MLRWVTETVCDAGLARVIVVVGAHAQSVKVAVSDLDVDLVFNEEWHAGMSTSVRVGIQALDTSIQAALLVLADQPAISTRLLRALVDRYRSTGAPLVAPFHQGRRGNPVLFDRRLFPELLSVEGDQGGRAIVTRHQDLVEHVEIEDPWAFMDVDTHQDYEALRSLGAH